MADNCQGEGGNRPPCLHCQIRSAIEIFLTAHPCHEEDDGCDLSNRDAYTLMALAHVIGDLIRKLPAVPDRIVLFDQVMKRMADCSSVPVTSVGVPDDDDPTSPPTSEGLH